MKNYSLTQAGNYSALISVLVLIISKFNLGITNDELTQIILALFTLSGILISWYGRYRQGDVSVLGIKAE